MSVNSDLLDEHLPILGPRMVSQTESSEERQDTVLIFDKQKSSLV